LKIEEHSLCIKACEKLRPLIETITPEDLMIESSRERHARAPALSAEQTYHYYVFWYTINMVKAFSRLNHITIYIKDLPKPASYLRQGITQYDWIQYHYHFYIVNVVGLYDIALKLTNAIFRLGVDEKQVNKSSVEDNLWVKQPGVSKLLRTLREATSQHRGPRRLFIHGGDLLKLDALDRLDVICMANKLTDEYSANAIKNLFEPDIDKLAGKMSNEISSLENIVINLFDKLLPVYDDNASTFKTIDEHKKT